MPPNLDHLVYAVPDLDRATAELSERLGVKPSAGGRHPGRGSRNALLSLGPSSYIEVIGPDTDQPDPQGPRPFGIDELRSPRLVTWAIAERDLEGRIERAARAGYDAGRPFPLSRDLPDGTHLEWRVARREGGRRGGEGLVPFLIDWGSCPHPAQSSAAGCALVELVGRHPEPERVRTELAALGVELRVESADEPALITTLDTPRGRVELS